MTIRIPTDWDPVNLPAANPRLEPPVKIKGRVLEQRQYWVDMHGKVVLLADMDQRYRANLYRFILKRAAAFHTAEAWSMAMVEPPNGDMASLFWEQEIDAFWDLDPIAFIEAKPLMRRLRRLLNPPTTTITDHRRTHAHPTQPRGHAHRGTLGPVHPAVQESVRRDRAGRSVVRRLAGTGDARVQERDS